jgi:hypothetical protein
MRLPFTTEQFFHVFGNYNQSVWPMQIVLYLLGAISVILAILPTRNSNKIISVILAFLWLWMGIVYHLIFFTQINKAAYLFGIVYIIQSYLFILTGVFDSYLTFNLKFNVRGVTGVVFILYALIIYPIWGFLAGHLYPYIPIFGLPCPTTIFTFGFLLWTTQRFPKYLLIGPFLWSIIGFFAAIKLDVYQDYVLLVSGVIGTILILLRDKNNRPRN